MINPHSELAARYWHQGAVADCPIIDFHAHMGEWRSIYLPRCTPEGMLRSMDEVGVQLTIFSSHIDLFAPASANSYNIEQARKYPQRFKAYFAVNPNYADPVRDLEIFQAHADVFVGFKTLPDYFGYPLSHSRYRPYWEFAAEKGLLVLSHTWGGSDKDGPDEAEKVLNEYPGIVLIAGHSFHGEWDRAADMAARHPQLYLDLCAVLDDRGVLELFVERAGAGKVLFGTDLPWFDLRYYVGAVLSADITDEARRDIFYRNGLRLLRRFPWGERLYNTLMPSSPSNAEEV